MHKSDETGILKKGIHQVKIQSVWIGKATIKKPEFIALRFENKYGYITQKFYLNDYGRKRAKKFFKDVGNIELPNTYDITLISCFKAIIDCEISIYVLDRNGYKSTTDWQKID